MIAEPYPFGLIKIAEPNFKEFINTELDMWRIQKLKY